MRANSSTQRRALRAGLALLAAVFAGCGAAPEDVSTLARFSGGTVTAEELGAAVLSLPAESRPADPEERQDFYRDLLRQVAVRDVLVARGRETGVLDEPEMGRQVRDTRRQILAGLFLSREVEVEQPTPDEVARFFEERRQMFDRPERREVYHIFLRPQPDESRTELTERMTELRRRSLEGEPFPLLAREYSESQLRHGDGALGWVSPGQLQPRLDEIVFGLEEGVPSEVLITPSGAHLFLASTVVEAQVTTLEEARPNARRLLMQERQSRAVADYLETQESDPADFEPSAEELQALLAGGDGNAVVLRVGDWTLTADELVERLEAEQGRRANVADAPAAYRLVRSLGSAERVLREAERAGIDEEEGVQESLRAAEENVLFPEMQRRGLRERALAAPVELEAFFREQSLRFAGPLRLRVERLAIPLAADSGRVMGELERAAAELDSGATSLDELAERFGGRLEDPVWRTLTELLDEGGSLRGHLAAVPAGGYSEPASNGRELEVFHVLERSEPEAPSFDSVRDEVVDAFVAANGERLYADLMDELLAAAELEIFEDHLAAFATSAVGVVPAGSATGTGPQEDL